MHSFAELFEVTHVHLTVYSVLVGNYWVILVFPPDPPNSDTDYIIFYVYNISVSYTHLTLPTNHRV